MYNENVDNLLIITIKGLIFLLFYCSFILLTDS